jgi:hypothetical protein
MSKLIVECSTLWADFNCCSVEPFYLDRTMRDTVFNLEKSSSVI